MFIYVMIYSGRSRKNKIQILEDSKVPKIISLLGRAGCGLECNCHCRTQCNNSCNAKRCIVVAVATQLQPSQLIGANATLA